MARIYTPPLVSLQTVVDKVISELDEFNSFQEVPTPKQFSTAQRLIQVEEQMKQLRFDIDILLDTVYKLIDAR